MCCPFLSKLASWKPFYRHCIISSAVYLRVVSTCLDCCYVRILMEWIAFYALSSPQITMVRHRSCRNENVIMGRTNMEWFSSARLSVTT